MLYILDVIGWDPREIDMEMEICKLVAYCGMSSGSIPASCEAGRIGQGEKVNWDAFVSEASATPTGSPGAGLVCQICSKLKQGC